MDLKRNNFANEELKSILFFFQNPEGGCLSKISENLR